MVKWLMTGPFSQLKQKKHWLLEEGEVVVGRRGGWLTCSETKGP